MPTSHGGPATAPQQIEWHFPRHARSVGRGRSLLREQTVSWKLPEEVTETAVLLLSELMTNAYRHARVSPSREIRAGCLLDIDRLLDTGRLLTAGRLRVWVTDANDTLPAPREALPEDESGRGLGLVAALADGWGAESRVGGVGKTVWFELRVP